MTNDLRQLIGYLVSREQTIAVAESLTGGLVASMMVDLPGVSQVFRGGIVCYATDTKATILGVDSSLLAAHGPVDPRTALAMAQQVRKLFGTDLGMATTGVAGPGAHDGHPQGTVYVAVATPESQRVKSFLLPGGREQVRLTAAAEVVALAWYLCRQTDQSPGTIKQ